MTDYKAKLAAERLKKQLEKVKKDTSPSMNVPFQSKKEKEKEPLPPDLAEFGLPIAQERILRAAIDEYATIGAERAKATKRQKELSKVIKEACKDYALDKFTCGDNKATYYKTDRASISKELMLNEGIAHDVIDRCTVRSSVWAIKVSGVGGEVSEE